MKNTVKVKIKRIIDFSVAGEKYLIFSLNGKIYEAFHNEGQEFKVDEEINAKLFLINFKIKKVIKQRQFADYIKSHPLIVNTYNVQGKVISKTWLEDGNWLVTIDAGNGFIFETRTADSFGKKLKQNNYVYVEGRLDINKARDSQFNLF